MSLRISMTLINDREQHVGREPDIRCALHRGLLSGLSGLMHVRLLLTQHFLALAASLIGQCSTFHQTGRSNASIQANLRRVFASLGPNNQDVDFSSARSTASCENSRPKSLVWFFYWSADTISICTPDQRRRRLKTHKTAVSLEFSNRWISNAANPEAQ